MISQKATEILSLCQADLDTLNDRGDSLAEVLICSLPYLISKQFINKREWISSISINRFFSVAKLEEYAIPFLKEVFGEGYTVQTLTEELYNNLIGREETYRRNSFTFVVSRHIDNDAVVCCLVGKLFSMNYIASKR